MHAKNQELFKDLSVNCQIKLQRVFEEQFWNTKIINNRPEDSNSNDWRFEPIYPRGIRVVEEAEVDEERSRGHVRRELDRRHEDRKRLRPEGQISGNFSGHDFKVRVRAFRYSWRNYCLHYHLTWLRIPGVGGEIVSE